MKRADAPNKLEVKTPHQTGGVAGIPQKIELLFQK
jgi:hypothetical protein